MGYPLFQRKRMGPRWKRAKLTIRFFELDTREELLRGRADGLNTLRCALLVIDSNLSADDKDFAQKYIERLISPKNEHSSCIKAAYAMYQKDPGKTRQIFEAARDYLNST